MDVTEIGRRSPAPVTGDVLGNGVIWAVFQTSGTLHCVNEKLTNLAMTGPSFTAHVLYIQEDIPSGPEDVDLILPKTVMKKSALNGTNATNCHYQNCANCHLMRHDSNKGLWKYVLNMTSAHDNADNWPLKLSSILAAYRMTVYETTGTTPNMTLLGRDVILSTTLIVRPPDEPMNVTVPFRTRFPWHPSYSARQSSTISHPFCS